MLDFMERSAVKLLKKRGNTNAEIAEALGRDRKTIERVLAEPADKKLQRPERGSLVDPYRDKICQWIQEDIPTVVMLEKVRKDPQMPYLGGRTVFYDQVKLIHQELQMTKQKAIWRFEGLPGEYLQVDWGEKRNFPFTRVPRDTRYYFVGRLKYSRWIHAEFCTDMRYETFIHHILKCFENLGGVPWVLIFDNMRIVTKGRNADREPIWNPKFRQFASEMGFHPELCEYEAPNQKGTVENGVKYVKRNFLAGRTFLDDEDLSLQMREWLDEKNGQKSQAHGQVPNDLLAEEQKAFKPFMDESESYGLLHLLRVNPESVIRFETNCYSVPEHLIGQILAVRVTPNELRIYHNGQLMAQHHRSFEKGKWIRDLSHYEKTLSKKPRAKVMAYREKLLELDSPTASYVAEICRRDRNAMNQQVLKLYSLWKEHGVERFIEAIRFCHESGIYGAEYVELMLRIPKENRHEMELLLSDQPMQLEVDRDITAYDKYIHR